MKISDELIACYVEGTVTAEERNFVRRYLCEHPETYEHILCLMDNDTVDYLGEQFIIELKIWRGDAYNTRGEKQSWDYLSYYHLDKGYMLSFNFNKNKKIGVKELHLNGKILIEATV